MPGIETLEPVTASGPTLASAYHGAGAGTPEIADITRVVADLAVDPNHPDWRIVDGLAQWTRNVPAGTFDVFRAMAAHPQAAAMAVLRATSAAPLLWRAMESFSYSWWLVPSSAWFEAMRAFVGTLRAGMFAFPAGPGFSDPEQLVRAQYDSAVNLVAEHLPHLRMLLGLQQRELFGAETPPEIWAAVSIPQIRDQFLGGVRARIADVPILPPELQKLPSLEGIDQLVEELLELPGADRLVVLRGGRFAAEERFAFVNAPVIAVLAVLSDFPLSPVQRRDLCLCAQLDTAWFMAQYRDAFLFALSSFLHRLQPQ